MAGQKGGILNIDGRFFKNGGNSFSTVSAVLGTNNSIPLSIITNSTIKVQIDVDGSVTFGNTGVKFAGTFFSIRSLGNNNTTYAWQAKDSGGVNVLGFLRDDGIINSLSGYDIGPYSALRLNGLMGNITIANLTPDVSYSTDNFAGGFAALRFLDPSNLGGNTAIGSSSLTSLTSGTGGNTGIGGYSLSALTTGFYNTSIGFTSGRRATTGTGLTFIGSYTGLPVGGETISYGVAIGNEAALRANNQLVVGSNAAPINYVYFGTGQGTTDAIAFTSNPVYIHASGDVDQTLDNSNSNSILYLRGSRAVGNGTPAGVVIQYSPKVGSGTTYQTFQDALSVDGATGNIGVWGSSFVDGEKVIFIANAATVPSADPTGGFILYVDPADDKLKARGPGGLVTVLANPV